jgi:hypothetical protein
LDEGEQRVHVKCVLTGEPAWVLRELLRRGVACSVREAVAHGLLAYYDVVLERDLKRRDLRSARRRKG